MLCSILHGIVVMFDVCLVPVSELLGPSSTVPIVHSCTLKSSRWFRLSTEPVGMGTKRTSPQGAQVGRLAVCGVSALEAVQLETLEASWFPPRTCLPTDDRLGQQHHAAIGKLRDATLYRASGLLHPAAHARVGHYANNPQPPPTL